MTTENKKLLEALDKTPYGKALKEFLDEQYADIADIRKSQSWEETLGRKFALKVLEDLFATMKGNGVKERAKNQYT